MTFRICAVLCGFTVAICSGLTAMNLLAHDVRVVTKTVQEDPGPPDATLPGEQLNTQLQGWTCQVWEGDGVLTFKCSS